MSIEYQQIAADSITQIESHHLIAILLDSKIFMGDQGLLELALSSRRQHFLNSETLSEVITHMWQTVDYCNPRTNQLVWLSSVFILTVYSTSNSLT